MTNLLPYNQRQARIRDQYTRLLIVCIVAAALLVFIGGMALVPSLVYVEIRSDDVRERRESLEASVGVGQHEEVTGSLVALAGQIERLSESLDGVLFSTHLETLARVRTAEIHLNEVVFNQSTDSVRLSGVADSREALIAFVDALNAESSFTGASVPVGTLVRESDIQFLLQITLVTDTTHEE